MTKRGTWSYQPAPEGATLTMERPDMAVIRLADGSIWEAAEMASPVLMDRWLASRGMTRR